MSGHPSLPVGIVKIENGAAVPISPLSSPQSVKTPRYRKRSLDDGQGLSPSSDEEEVDGTNKDRRRQPGVKRACNECRQQKASSTGIYVVV